MIHQTITQNFYMCGKTKSHHHHFCPALTFLIVTSADLQVMLRSVLVLLYRLKEKPPNDVGKLILY